MTRTTKEPENYRKLRKKFERPRSTAPGVFTQVKASEKAFLYKREDEGHIYWEVFERRIRDFKGDWAEQYPKDASFGKWAWCYNNYEKALRHFDYLNTRTKQQDLKP